MEEEDLIPTITGIARNSPILSVRGYVIILHLSCLGDHHKKSFYRTCFFVLGLISSTTLGAEVLDDYGWEATTSPLGMPTGLAIPMNVQEFVSVREVLDI
jgi:rapamycin-insensitive companion of mTOR